MKSLFFLLFPTVFAFSIKAQSPLLDSLAAAAHSAVRQGDRNAEASALAALAREQAYQGNTFDALQNAQRAIDIFESLGKKAEAIEAYVPLLIVHQQLHNGQKIKEIAEAAIQFAEQTQDTALLANMKTAIGIGYDEMNEYEKAANAYLEAARLDEAMGSSTALNHSNASSSFTTFGNFAEGIRHARLAAEKARAEGLPEILMLARLNESYALIKSGDPDAALAALAQAERLADSLKMAQMPRDIALVKALAFAAKRDFENAYRFHVQFFQIDSTLSSAERNAHFAELETIYNTKKKEVENAQLAARLTRQRAWLAGVLTAVLLLATIAWLLHKRLKINAKLLETEKALAEAERLHAAEEKQFFQRELDDFTQLLLEKNQALEALNSRLENAAAADSPSPGEGEILQAQLLQSTILTDADWRSFKQKFERVHHGFFEKFSQRTPDATEAELRLAALTRLELSNGEIAAMLGISPESVSKTRYRLKKKLGEMDLEEAVRV